MQHLVVWSAQRAFFWVVGRRRLRTKGDGLPSKRRERMREFRESGILGTPRYAAYLRFGLVLSAATSGLGIFGLLVYSPSGNSLVYFWMAVALLILGIFFSYLEV